MNLTQNTPNKIKPHPTLHLQELEEGKIYAYLIDAETNSFVDCITGEKSWRNQPSFYTESINKLIKRNNGIKPTQTIRFSMEKLLEPNQFARN